MKDVAPELSRAVTSFLGFGQAAWPKRDGTRLVEEFGPEKAAGLELAVAALLDELGALEIDWSMHSLETAGSAARSMMRVRHPELSDSALQALEWKFTYDWR